MQDKLGSNIDSNATLLWYLEYAAAFGVVNASAEVSYNINYCYLENLKIKLESNG